MLDDYVFLEATTKNEKFLRKQTELGISWVKKAGKPVLISQREMDRMTFDGVTQVKTGDEILVVQGFCSNLEGEIIEEDPDNPTKIKVRLKGWKRIYEQWIDRMDVVPKGFRVEKATDGVAELE